nr:MAG TPA: hypothetical protein [Caudoviricetes sp.]
MLYCRELLDNVGVFCSKIPHLFAPLGSWRIFGHSHLFVVNVGDLPSEE